MSLIADSMSQDRSSSSHRISDEHYEVLCTGGESFDMGVQTDFPSNTISIDELFSCSDVEKESMSIQTPALCCEELQGQLNKLLLINKQLAIRNMEVEDSLEELRMQVKGLRKPPQTKSEQVKENELISLKQIVQSYQEEQKKILHILGVSKTKNGLKAVVEHSFVQLHQYLHQLSQELTLLRAISFSTPQKLQPAGSAYNHCRELRKICQIKENIIQLHKQTRKA